MNTQLSEHGAGQILDELSKLNALYKEVITRLEQIERNMQQLGPANRYLNIPEASKRYKISPARFRDLCKHDVIKGCYSLLNENKNREHYIIDCIKLDQYLALGGIIAAQVKKYQQKY